MHHYILDASCRILLDIGDRLVTQVLDAGELQVNAQNALEPGKGARILKGVLSVCQGGRIDRRTGCFQEAGADIAESFVSLVSVVWYRFAIEIDHRGPGVPLVREKPDSAWTCARLLSDKHLVRRTFSEKVEIGGVSKFVGGVDFVDLNSEVVTS